MSSIFGIILHGRDINDSISISVWKNTSGYFYKENGTSATGCLQHHLKEQQGPLLGPTTWAVRQFLTPVMAIIEFPIRIAQLALTTFLNVITGSFLRSEDKSPLATWHNKLATWIRNENDQLLVCSGDAFISIFPFLDSCCNEPEFVPNNEMMRFRNKVRS